MAAFMWARASRSRAAIFESCDLGMILNLAFRGRDARATLSSSLRINPQIDIHLGT